MTVKQKFLEAHGEKWNAYTANKQGDCAESYQDPKLIEVKNAKEGCFVITYKNRMDQICAEFYVSKRVKNQERYRFRSEKSRTAYVKKWIAIEQRHCQRIAEERKQKSEQGRGVEVGDILSATWGYEQTNWNYYQVTKLIGNTMVEVREVSQMREETEWMQGKCAPVPDSFISEPMRKKAVNGTVKINSSIWASPVEYKDVNGARIYNANHYTAYA